MIGAYICEAKYIVHSAVSSTFWLTDLSMYLFSASDLGLIDQSTNQAHILAVFTACIAGLYVSGSRYSQALVVNQASHSPTVLNGCAT